MTWLDLAVVVLATARLTRLVTSDYLTDPPRVWLQRRLPEKLAYLLGCPWCASVWVAAPVAWVVVEHGHRTWVLVPLVALGASHLTGLAARLDPPPDYGLPDDVAAEH